MPSRCVSRSAASLRASCLLVTLLFIGGSGATAGDDDDDRPAFRNPYFEKTEWRVWRDNDQAIEGVTSMVREGKEKKNVEVTIQPPPDDKRVYPVDPPAKLGKSPYVVFKASKEPSTAYAGMWDDVYSSWSGLHGYVRNRWRGDDGSNVTVRGNIMDFVDVRTNQMIRSGVNFVHQSTTSMGHAIANGGRPQRTLEFEKLYFANLLVTAPAHASWTDHRADYTTDLYTAHIPTLFNSVGSSNSETMAITKLAIVGAYLPPATKLLLKRNGLYPAALLYIWKAALPYDVPYDHELRHRIAYKAVGDRVEYSKIEKYGAAGIDRGDLSLPFHCYDDGAHMRAMIDLARSMDVALPEAIFTVVRARGEADGGYRLRKSALVIQEKGKDIELKVSTVGCYDLQDLPVETRWKLLYGNKQTSVQRSAEDPDEWVIKVPWDDALPAGRTAIALIANNGRFDSNPAIITVYRKKTEDLPPSGLGPKDYRWPGTHDNRRPVLLGLQDTFVKRGKLLALPLTCVDPEGFPVSFHRRGGDVGEIDGSLFSWRCPKKAAKGERTVTLIASDMSGGSSYGGEALTIHVGKPPILAQIAISDLTGKAPMTVKVSAKPSIGKRLKYGWDFYTPSHKLKPKARKDMQQGREATHTFKKPGVYEIALVVENFAGTDRETIRVLVAKDEVGADKSMQLEGNGVRIQSNDDTPDLFDHTDFGLIASGDEVVRTFRIVNGSNERLRLDAKNPVTVQGEHADAFRVVRKPRRTIAARGSALFEVRFRAKDAGAYQVSVQVHSPTKHTFAARGSVK